MRNIILIFLGILLFSCHSQKFASEQYLSVYKRDRVGNVDTAYIILRTKPKVFEIYAPGISSSTFGEWDLGNDTLFLYPKWECLARDYNIKLWKITQEDQSVTSIPQQYILKDNILYDITDYSIVIPEYLNSGNFIEEFKKIK